MGSADPLVVETVTRILRDLADPQTVNSGTNGSWHAPLWAALEESGLTRAWLAADLGGAGAATRGSPASCSAHTQTPRDYCRSC